MTDILFEIITVAAAGGIVTAITQLVRKNYPSVSPKSVAIVLAAVFGCGMYLLGLLPPELQANIALAVGTIWTTSVTIYEIFKNRS